MNFFIRLGINAAALGAAAAIVGGIHLEADFWSVVFISLIFGLVNALIKPVALVLSLPALILTLGLFTVVVNAGMLGLTAALTDRFDIDSFGSAVLGALIVSLVSWILSALFDDGRESQRG